MWQVDSWRNQKILHIPSYKNQAELEAVERTLHSFPPLVFAGEVRALRRSLANVTEGKEFILQAGDCAESFSEFSADTIRDTFRVILQMAVILTAGTNLPVLKIGRMAGQFAKPRSEPLEKRGQDSFPSYMGDIINGIEFNSQVREPDPSRMLRSYSQSASTLNLLRAFADGGYANLKHVHSWNMGFVKNSDQGKRYRHLADKVEETLKFMDAMGVNAENTPQLKRVNFYTGHEALLLPYEQALTRADSTRDDEIYDTSAHFLWIGDRTRFLDSAHIEFCRGIKNPIGIKCGPSLEPDELLKMLEILNPDRIPGRIALITRYGYKNIETFLPPLLKSVSASGMPVAWSCDPMHGNTTKSSSGLKTRDFDKILMEVKSHLEIHRAEGTFPGGIHLEMTGQDVTECIGGSGNISENELSDRYHTHCDPRLNASQAIEMAFLIADELKKNGRK